jgi:predicted transglutaminase-like cysteine proteinase
MDALTTVAIAIAAFLLLIALTAMELKTASFMHTEKKSSSPQQNIGKNGCNTDKNECNTDENECNGIEDECDDLIQGKEK